ncbi:hypothetical protein ACF0H5_003422 [Mactra antiquata]
MDSVKEFDSSPYFESGAVTFFDDLENDSGVEELPFSNYVAVECSQSNEYSDVVKNIGGKGDDDEFSYIDDDDDDDVDYKPNRPFNTKKGQNRAKRRQYPNSGNRGYVKHEMFTPEKQIISRTGIDERLPLRQYNRKDRTPNTIRKLMERHRENERERHHSLNKSLKNVSMKVPGYDPNSKETKIVQMQRIIGYECFLENTLRAICKKLEIPLKVVLKGNTQFISDAMKNMPYEDFFISPMLHVDDSNDDTQMSGNTSTDDLPTGCRIIKSANIEENILKYRREKISSPTVDSTTDNFIQLLPIMPMKKKIKVGNQLCDDKEIQKSTEWLTQNGFKPIESSQEFLISQESGIKMDTQSSLDDFNEIDGLMPDDLYDESEQLRTVTPSFMKEEVVTSTATEDESFDFSSPVRYKDTVFLQSPPGRRGIWHSGKSGSIELRDTSLQMESVSPENILETLPKNVSTSDCEKKINSRIKPMSSILMKYDDENDEGYYYKLVKKPEIEAELKTSYQYRLTEDPIDSLQSFSGQDHQSCTNMTIFTTYQPSQHDQITYRTNLHQSSNMPSYTCTPSISSSQHHTKYLNSVGQVIKTAPVKVNIIHANTISTHRDKHNQFNQRKSNVHHTAPNTVISSGTFTNTCHTPVYRSSNKASPVKLRPVIVPVIPSDLKNKRKRYTPFKSSTITSNEQNTNLRIVQYPDCVKKMRPNDDTDMLVGVPRVVPLGRQLGMQPTSDRDFLQQMGTFTTKNKKQCAAFIPDSSTNTRQLTLTPEIISVKPENLYFF